MLMTYFKIKIGVKKHTYVFRAQCFLNHVKFTKGLQLSNIKIRFRMKRILNKIMPMGTYVSTYYSVTYIIIFYKKNQNS